MLATETLIELIKIIIGVTLVFVWLIRYDNIIEEFKTYRLPEWLRDLTGVTKLVSAVLIQSSDQVLVLVGATSLIFLMIAALGVHIRIKNPIIKMGPALIMLGLNLFLITNLL